MTQTAELYQFPAREAAEQNQIVEVLPVVASMSNGYTKTPNQILEKLAQFEGGGMQQRILRVVERATFGFHVDTSELSGSFVAKKMGYSKAYDYRNVNKEIDKLVDRKILIKKEGDRYQELGFNVEISEWIIGKQPSNKAGKAKESYVKSNPTEGLNPTPKAVKSNPKSSVIQPLYKENNKENSKNKNKDIVRKSDSNNDYCEVISYLNEKANKRFKNTPANHKNINARIKEGHSIDDLKAVIDHKSIQWGQDRQMIAYLRPSTLFSAKNFESYLSIVSLPPVASHSSNQRQTQQFSQTDYSLGTEGFEHV
jgi:phage replication O-like protein O